MSYATYLAGFVASLCLSVFLTRHLRGLAPRIGLVDRPDGRRHLHGEPIATVGGVAIVLAVAGALLLVVAVSDPDHLLRTDAGRLAPILGGALAMHLLGLWDDLRELPPRSKFLAEVLVALVVFVGGVRLDAVYIPGLGLLEFGFGVSLLLTILWLVAITNAFNLVDGADGLAGGAALLATLTMFVASLVYGHDTVALLLVVTAGAVLGFLHFNFPPASVFLGDAGSLFLGFLLAGLGLASSTKAATTVAIAIPVVAFGLPVLDTLVAMVRRYLRGQRLSEADRRHIHHRLIELGHSPREVALILYGACGVFALASLLLLSEDGRLVGLVFLIVGLAVWFGIQRLRIPELLEWRRLLDLGLHQRQIVARNVALREGAAWVAGAPDLRSALVALGRALCYAPFNEADLWLSADFLEDEAGARLFPDVAIADGGYIWRWRSAASPLKDRERCWEVSLPILDAEGSKVGRLTLRRPLGVDMPTDAQVIWETLLPELARAVAERRAVPPAPKVQERGSGLTSGALAASERLEEELVQ